MSLSNWHSHTTSTIYPAPVIRCNLSIVCSYICASVSPRKVVTSREENRYDRDTDSERTRKRFSSQRWNRPRWDGEVREVCTPVRF